MKKIILLVLVAFFGVQVVSAQKKVKRIAIEQRVKSYKANYSITAEQEAKLREAFAELGPESTLSDDEYKAQQTATAKKFSAEVLTPEQVSAFKEKRAAAAAARKAKQAE